MDEKDLIKKLVSTIDSLEINNEDWSESKIDFLRKYGHLT